MRTPGLLGTSLAVALMGLSCASTEQRPDGPVEEPHAGRTAAAAMAGVDTSPRDAARLRPPARQPFAVHEACGARVELVRASPIVFETKLVRTLYEVEVQAHGPVGLVVTLGDLAGTSPSFGDVTLTPLVALKVPAGPARDAPRGPSGMLFDLGGLAVAGMVNLALFPVTVPLGILAGRPDAFLMDVPTFTDGMFDDVVLDPPAWEKEVARRAAPHQEALAREAERLQRFATWKGSRLLEQQPLACTIDEGGACALSVLWPESYLSASFSGLPCTQPPPRAPNAGAADAPNDEAVDPPPFPPRPQSTSLPALPPPTPPAPLLGPPRATSDVRGEGAEATHETWRRGAGAVLADPAAAALWKDARRARGAKGAALREVTLVCQLRVRGGGFDVDDSPPELRLRLAWGYDDQVAGQTFGTWSTRQRSFGVSGVTLLPGELVKLSVVDVDAFVDDWIGMEVLTFDGTLPLRFEHARFTAECGARDESFLR